MAYTAIKVRLIPTRTQEIALKQHAGAHRYAYNFAKSYSEQYYEEHGVSISVNEISKVFRRAYDSIPWVVDICKDVNHEAIRDYGTARSNSFRKYRNGYHTSYKSRPDFIEVKGEQGGDVYRLRYYPQSDGSFECYEK